MSKIVIKKRIGLDFLGDEYKDSYLVFKSIPIGEADQIAKEAEIASSSKKASIFICDMLTDKFLEGKFFNGTELVGLSKEDIKDIDIATCITIFEILTGQAQSPKA